MTVGKSGFLLHHNLESIANDQPGHLFREEWKWTKLDRRLIKVKPFSFYYLGVVEAGLHHAEKLWPRSETTEWLAALMTGSGERRASSGCWCLSCQAGCTTSCCLPGSSDRWDLYIRRLGEMWYVILFVGRLLYHVQCGRHGPTYQLKVRRKMRSKQLFSPIVQLMLAIQFHKKVF